MLIVLDLDLCEILESSVFLDTHYPIDFDNIECEIGFKILYHVTPPIQFCHSLNTGLATGLKLVH